jgi:hypothetical protein
MSALRLVALVAALLGCAAYVSAQGCALQPDANTIALAAWTDIGTESTSGGCLPADWQFPAVNTATQSTNTCGVTHLVSDFIITSSDIIRGTLTGTITAVSPDDDYIGFNIGQNCGPETSTPTAASCSGSEAVSREPPHPQRPFSITLALSLLSISTCYYSYAALGSVLFLSCGS